jgi:hypothetical protein
LKKNNNKNGRETANRETAIPDKAKKKIHSLTLINGKKPPIIRNPGERDNIIR